MPSERNGGIFHYYRRHLPFFLILLVAVGLVYGNSLSNGFVWDDNEIIVNNPVNKDMHSIGTLFGSADDLAAAAGVHAPYYRPLNRLTYIFDYQMFGLNPVGYHAENLLIHLASVLCLYLLAVWLFGEQFPALTTALLFAVHPINAEAVNFISGRNNLLATLAVLLSFLTFVHGEESHKVRYRYVAGVLFLMGLLCKETALMAIPFLFLHDISSLRYLRERFWKKVASLLPFLVGTGIYLAMRTVALAGTFGGNPDWEHLGRRLLQVVYIIPRYGEILLFPHRLTVDYDVPAHFSPGDWWLLPAWLVGGGVLVVLLKTGRAATRFGLLWFAVNFIPIANIIPIPSAPMAERFMYLPAIGLWIVAADQAWALYGKARRVTAVAGSLVLLVLAAVTFTRNRDWRNDISLFSSVVKATPDSSMGHYNLGVALMKRGDVAKAEREFMSAVEIDPAHSDALFQIASILLARNSYEEAEKYLARSLQANPGNSEALFNLALLMEKRGRTREAIAYYEEFLTKAPDMYDPLIPRVRGKIRELRGD